MTRSATGPTSAMAGSAPRSPWTTRPRSTTPTSSTTSASGWPTSTAPAPRISFTCIATACASISTSPGTVGARRNLYVSSRAWTTSWPSSPSTFAAPAPRASSGRRHCPAMPGDRCAPWITRLPFPVHVVERVDTFDRLSGNRFVTRYAYHHGYFDGEEREFRGFGMVEQRDTEEFATLAGDGALPEATNVDAASHVPPVLTKTWFHTGVYVGGGHVSDFFAGLLDERDTGEYYREPGLSDAQAKELLLPDTVMPAGLTAEEEQEACRALKGVLLRQEVYALDGTDKAEIPYAVTEHNFTVRRVQPRAGNQHAVFFTHAREAISYHYERNPADPRVSHALTLEVDDYANVLKSLGIGYGRRQSSLPEERDREKQTGTLITYTENAD